MPSQPSSIYPCPQEDSAGNSYCNMWAIRQTEGLKTDFCEEISRKLKCRRPYSSWYRNPWQATRYRCYIHATLSLSSRFQRYVCQSWTWYLPLQSRGCRSGKLYTCLSRCHKLKSVWGKEDRSMRAIWNAPCLHRSTLSRSCAAWLWWDSVDSIYGLSCSCYRTFSKVLPSIDPQVSPDLQSLPFHSPFANSVGFDFTTAKSYSATNWVFSFCLYSLTHNKLSPG